MAKHVHIVGLDDHDLEELRSLRGVEGYEFHGLVPYAEIVSPELYDLDRILATAREQLARAPGVDGIVGHWDFPTTSLLPILREEHGLPTPRLESVLCCDHKYWARRAMREAVPECTPPFQHVDPFAEDPWAGIELELPFWIKPVVAYSSTLGFRIESEEDFRRAIPRIREGIGRFAEPFERILRHVRDRNVLPAVGSGASCIAEGIISGDLCTLEGFGSGGEVEVYGVLDSERGPNQVSFVSYRVPSHLPLDVQERMEDYARRIATHIGLDATPFNMEFFWNRGRDEIWLLEINPRISRSHCALFRMTAGASHHEVAVALATGARPDFPRHDGAFAMAAKFMPRTYADATVTRVPSPADLAKARDRYPELVARIHVREGMRLRDLRDQDSYSFELAELSLGGESEHELQDKFRDVMRLLDFRFSEPVETNYA